MTARSRSARWGSSASRVVAGIAVSPLTLAALVLAGLAIRAFFYVANHSLTLDEAFIALNIQRKSASGLLGELDWNSAAPPAFLEIEKALETLFGSSEQVLRALPFAAALVSVLVFTKLAGKVLSTPAHSIAVLLFIGVASATAYAAIIKPYSLDLLLALALYLATLAVLRARSALSATALLGIGIIAPMFSYASVFVLVASAAVLLIVTLVRTNRAIAIQAGIVVVGWSSILAIGYVIHGDTLSHLLSSLSREEIGLNSIRQTMGAVRIAVGVSPSVSPLGGFAAGAASICAAILFVIGFVRIARRTWDVAILLALPGFFAIIASFVGLYPILPRTFLFLVPTLVICIAEGFAVGLRSRSIGSRAVAMSLVTAVVLAEGMATAEAIRNVTSDNGMKPIIRVLAHNIRSNDTIYFSYASQYPFAYYLDCGCMEDAVTVHMRKHLPPTVRKNGVDQWAPALASRSERLIIGDFRAYSLESYVHDFARFPHGRVWVVLSFLHPEQRQTLLAQLDRRGTRLKSYGKQNDVDSVNAHLYAFQASR